MIFNRYAKGGSGGILPVIVVTAPTGSTVTATYNGKTYTASEVSGTWTIKVKELGTYTVTATLGGDTSSTTVVVEEVGVYTCTLSYQIYTLINGDSVIGAFNS